MKLLTIVILLFSLSLLSQEEIFGTVSNEQGQVLENIVMTIKKDSLGPILAYTISNSIGIYRLKISPTCLPCILEFSSLGYEKKKFAFNYSDSEEDFKLDVTLKTNAFSLDEVIISSDRPIRINKDTITFNAKSFTDGTETVAEDLLRKIPGISVLEDGTIKIGNKEVEKVMVEGDDFFDKGYKTLTKNLPAAPIEKVELLQHYSNNKLLKGIEESNKVALNLTLNEDAKRQWFGNFDLGYDITFNERYDARANLLNFGKKNKYYFFTNLNNVGYDATGDISNLIRSNRRGEPGSIGDGEQTGSFVNLSNALPNFKRKRYNFNNAELLSLNAIFNPTDKLKIKPIAFLNWDERDFFRNSTASFISNGTDFTNIENYRLTNDLFTGFGKLDINYDISKTQTIESSTRYSNSSTNDRVNRTFNTIENIEEVDGENTRFDHKTTYSNKLTDHKVLLITGRYINEENPQRYTINQFLFEDLFPDTNTVNNIAQSSNQKLDYLGFEAHLLDRKEQGHLLELKLGNSYREDRIENTFSLLNNAQTVTNPDGFQNNTRYQVNDTYFNAKYSYALTQQFKLTGNIENHLINNQLSTPNNEDDQTVFYVNPSLGAKFEINTKNKIAAAYGFTRSNADVATVYDQFTLNNFRSFSRGTGGFNQLDASSFTVNYTLGNFSDKFFANLFGIYTKSFDFFSTNSTVAQNFVLSNRTLFEDRELVSISSNIDRYFKTVSSNLKLQLSFAQTNFKNIVNDSSIRTITTTNYSIGLEWRSAFSGIFNYHIGTKWLINEIETTFDNSFTDNVSFLDLSFLFSERFNVQLQTERYFFGNLQQDRTFFFGDISARYILKKNKITLSLNGKNLFNTTTFSNFSLNDLGSSTTEFRLLPRYILLKGVYRF